MWLFGTGGVDIGTSWDELWDKTRSLIGIMEDDISIFRKVIIWKISRWWQHLFKMKNDLTTGTWQDNIWCPIIIISFCTSDVQHNNHALAIAAYTTSAIPITSRLFTKPRPRLLFLLVLNLVGSLWAFATTSSYMDSETFSFEAYFSNDYDCLNGLLDDTINDICHQVHAYAASNESFMHLQMLREEDHKQIFKAIKVKLADHKFCNHWTLMERKDLPIWTKMVMAI